MRDPKIEQFLKANGYNFVFQKGLELASIDLNEARANPARLHRQLDEDRAISIGVALDSGLEMPAIIVLDIGDGLPKLLMTGMHRCVGAELAKPKVKGLDAYVVREADPLRVELLRRASNVPEGQGMTHREKMTHIAYLRREHPHLTLDALAQIFSVKKDGIGLYIKEMDAEQRAFDLGFGNMLATTPTRFPQQLKVALGGIHNDNVFSSAIQLIVDHPDFKGAAALEFVKAVKEYKTERQASDYIQERDEELTKSEQDKKNRRARTQSSKGTKLLGLCRVLCRLFPGPAKLREWLAGLDLKSDDVRLVERLREIAAEMVAATSHQLQEQERADQWRAQTTPQPGRSTSDGPSLHA